MIKKIILSGIVLCLFIAIPLALMGYKQVELGAPFMALLRGVSKDLENFKIALPDIPTIPQIASESSGGNDILSVLINLANGIISFINTLIKIINVLIQIVNIVIQVIEVVVLIVKNLIVFKDIIAAWNPVVV